MIEFVLLPLIVGYLFGSIPFGLLLTKLAGHGDIRTIGSGNIGATNVLRTGNKKLALLTLLLDGGKGAAAVCVVTTFTYAAALPVALGAVLGHCFPIWLRFKGGKGVATALGVLLAALPLVGLTACALWAIVFFFSRISSLSALVAFISVPVSTFIFYDPHFMLITSIISLIIIVRHKDNIKRLLKGEEPKFSKGSTGHASTSGTAQ